MEREPIQLFLPTADDDGKSPVARRRLMSLDKSSVIHAHVINLDSPLERKKKNIFSSLLLGTFSGAAVQLIMNAEENIGPAHSALLIIW